MREQRTEEEEGLKDKTREKITVACHAINLSSLVLIPSLHTSSAALTGGAAQGDLRPSALGSGLCYHHFHGGRPRRSSPTFSSGAADYQWWDEYHWPNSTCRKAHRPLRTAVSTTFAGLGGR